MGRKYQQLSLENRCEIARLQADGCSIRQIAAALDRAPSTISREVKRNRGRHIGYKPSYAQEQTQARRWAGTNGVERNPKVMMALPARRAAARLRRAPTDLTDARASCGHGTRAPR